VTKGWLDDVGQVLLVWAVALAMEHVFVCVAWREEIAGAWELWPARTAAAPIFLGVSVVAAIACVVLDRLAAQGDHRPAHAAAVLAGMALGWGVGSGRHFERVIASVPLYRIALALGVGIVALGGARAYFTMKKRVPEQTRFVLVGLAVLVWWVDGHVLVRLYPAFHAGLFALSLVTLAFAAIGWKIASVTAARVVVVACVACALYTPFAAKRLRSFDNLRRVLVEHAPWMGRAVRVGAAISPPGAVLTSELLGPGEVTRALDWTGLDVVLVSIDALRADHVGAYGYARPTTPRIDALAAMGTLFRNAYCPTPHTSYSVTSMMTGKYMRPLLALGLGQDSETLASQLRRYGYRTAAFYPPAVFFIDAPKFVSFEERALDFEYRKVEFADPELREAQVREYLATAPTERPLLLWVHFFEPHEPYVQHPEHHFGDTDVDAYDSEIAAADDGVGRVVGAIQAVRPHAVVIVTADHGEEFGDHGGRYHGTTVYEEQVRVPLVVVGKGVRAGASIDEPVQTIDLLPTILSALGVPRPPRVRGRDLGAALSGHAIVGEPGFAFAETDDFSLLAKRSLRLVCDKQTEACSLFDVDADRGEKHDVSQGRGGDVAAMRSEIVTMERSHGRFEGQGAALPDALRRGSAGDVAAAEEVAGLLDDVNVTYRREAAQVLYDLRSPKVAAQLARAAAKNDDEEVRGTCTAALVRVDPSAAAGPAHALLTSPSVDLRRRAALALAERNDASGAAELTGWLAAPSVDFARQREIVDALSHAKVRSAVPALITLLDDVRVRSIAARALGALGDPTAKAALAAHFATESYVSARPYEANALVTLGAGKEIYTPLARFAGLPEPMSGAVAVAMAAGLLDAAHSGHASARPEHEVQTTLRAPAPGPLRLGVLVEAGSTLTLEIDTQAVASAIGPAEELWANVAVHGDAVSVKASAHDGGILAVWLVPSSSEAR
jgi:arylsulfatase A-like enzyme